MADEVLPGEFGQSKGKRGGRRSTSWGPGEAPKGGRPKGTPNKATQEIRELAQSLTTGNPKWVENTRARLEEGKENPGVVTTLLHYAHGKPKETVQLEGSESLSELLLLALGKREDKP